MLYATGKLEAALLAINYYVQAVRAMWVAISWLAVLNSAIIELYQTR